jgi:proline dehydrogenase
MDMEDSSTTSANLDLYRRLRAEGHENVGIVLQAMLRRTLDDVHDLVDLKPNVRVCKGIYPEPAEIAYQGDQAIRFNLGETMAALWEGGAKVAVASHDDAVIAKALALIGEGGLGTERYEFQLLLGVREDLADRLVRDGHTVRVYVPYGRKWYEYSLRRLQENPKMAGYVARDILGRLKP